MVRNKKENSAALQPGAGSVPQVVDTKAWRLFGKHVSSKALQLAFIRSIHK